MAVSDLKVHVKRRWWVSPFIDILGGLYRATGWHPEPEKLGKFLAEYGFVYSLRPDDEC